MVLDVIGWLVVGVSAFLAGFSRTGLPGLGILLASLVAFVMPVKASIGFLLPLFVAADLMVILYWRRRVAWIHLFRILPWTAIGVVIGYFVVGVLDEAVFKPVLGCMIVGIVALDYLRRWAKIDIFPEGRIFSIVAGILAGIFTMMANAAGPIMAVYLLSMKMPKEEFAGTSAFFYFIVNIVKLPFSVSLGLITWESFRLDLALLPLIALGALAGLLVLKRISQSLFNTIVQAIAAVGGIKLLF